MKRTNRLFVLAVAVLLALAAASHAKQININRIERIPDHPRPFHVRDWQTVAWEFDRLAFDLEATGRFLPLVSLTDYDGEAGFAMPAYVGDERGDPDHPPNEGIAGMGAILSATFAGIDKSRQSQNWVALCDQYYVAEHDIGVVLNSPTAREASSWWYAIFPNILFSALAEQYPEESRIQTITNQINERWLAVIDALTQAPDSGGFASTGFDFQSMTPHQNGKWREPDSGAGLAWLMYMAHRRAAEKNADAKAKQYLQAARRCLRFYRDREKNPAYEILMPFGAYTAARLNAEHEANYDLRKLVKWCFTRSDARPTMLMNANTWDGQDIYGLMGFNKPNDTDRGYAFAMNTFATAWPIVPIARYDERFARAIGKWMLGAAHAARYFYPNALPPARQTSAGWAQKQDPFTAVAYEGLRHRWMAKDEPLTAGGDPLSYDWGPKTDLGLYGSAYVGVFGGIIERTNHRRILQLDLLATDLYHDRAYPTYLYYNPYGQAKRLAVPVSGKPVNFYDAVSNRFLRRGIRGAGFVTIPPKTAMVLVLTPAGEPARTTGGRTRVDGVVIDYRPGD
jgi:hypothetical protein